LASFSFSAGVNFLGNLMIESISIGAGPEEEEEDEVEAEGVEEFW
jgi:hypothetical protein